MARSPKRTTDAQHTDEISRIRGGFGGYDADMAGYSADGERPVKHPDTYDAISDVDHELRYRLIAPTHNHQRDGRTGRSAGMAIHGGSDGYDTTSGRVTTVTTGDGDSPSGFTHRGSPAARRLLTAVDRDTDLFNAIAHHDDTLAFWFSDDVGLPVEAAMLIADSPFHVVQVTPNHADTPYTHVELARVGGGD